MPDRVGRSNIPKAARLELYKSSENHCNVCGIKFNQNYLAPDHRIPSIVEPDNLHEGNYLSKLQVLCVYCNQVKRESCKKCPYDHQCEKCHWAYPEKFNVGQPIFKKMKAKADLQGITVNQLLRKYFP